MKWKFTSNEYYKNMSPVPIDVSPYECGWNITEIIQIMECIRDASMIIWGGDILNARLEYTYDNWHYDFCDELSWKDNCDCSFEKAKAYVNMYTKRNSGKYFVVIVSGSFK